MAVVSANDYYITITKPVVVSQPGSAPELRPRETVLTKPFGEKHARHTLFKWSNILGMSGLEMNKYGDGRKYRSLMKEQSKRRKKKSTG